MIDPLTNQTVVIIATNNINNSTTNIKTNHLHYFIAVYLHVCNRSMRHPI